jgi:hypothetical protein
MHITTSEKFSFIGSSITIQRGCTACQALAAFALRGDAEIIQSMADVKTLGSDFARALAEKDTARLGRLFAADLDFRALTPRKTWQAQDADGVLEIVFGHWFDDGDRIDSLEQVETDSFADRERVGYRLAVSNPEGNFLVEQQAYLSEGTGEDEGKIAWMRVLCAGYRPVAAP